MPDVYGTARGRVRARLASPLAARARARRHERFFALTGVAAGMRVVDVGCGALGLRGLEPDLDITGVDLAPRPQYPGPFVQADATERLPFDDGAFDLAYSSSVVEHVDPARRAGVRRRAPARGPRLVRPDPRVVVPDRAARPAALRALAARRRCGARTGAWAPPARGRTSRSCAGPRWSPLFGEPVHAERLGGAGQELDRAAGDRYLERLIHSPPRLRIGSQSRRTWRGERWRTQVTCWTWRSSAAGCS